MHARSISEAVTGWSSVSSECCEMPSMATSHGGILYYVVQVPKEEQNAHERWTATHKYLEEKHVVTSTPRLNDKTTANR